MTTDFRELCAELLGVLENEGHAHWPGGPDGDPLIERARAALAEPVPPADGELAELLAWLRANALTVQKASGNPANGAKQRMNRAADLLSRLAPQPVPEGRP